VRGTGKITEEKLHEPGETMTAIDTTTPSPHQPKLRLHFRSNTIGSRLFGAVMAGAFAGLAGTAVLFYQTLESRATSQIRYILNTEVNNIEGRLQGAQYFARGLGSAVKFARDRGTTKAEDFKPLIFESFVKRPDLAMATYFIQKPYGIVTDREWYAPYYYQDQKAEGQKGERMPAPNDTIIYSELFKDDNYPQQDYYKQSIAAQKDIWIEPYPWYGVTMTSFFTPIQNAQGKMIAFSGVDVNVDQISKGIQPTVFENAGYFALLSQQGNLLSYPPDSAKAKAIDSYAKVPALKAIWPQLKTSKTGLVKVDGKYWAYRRLPSNNWLMLAVVPESAVIGPALGMTLAGTAGAALILAIVVTLFVRWLNRRLEPILEECNKLAQTDEQTQQMLSNQDEIGQLSSAFFNVVTQLSEKQEQIQREADLRVRLEEQQRQMIEAESRALQNDVGMLLDAVAAVEDGDLTIQAPVSDRATGLVADTLNRLVEQLGLTMTQVLTAAQQVSLGSVRLDELAETVASNANQQSQGVTEVLTLTEQVEKAAQNSAVQVSSTTQSLLTVEHAVEQGQDTLTQMNAAIATLQQGTEQIVQKMKTLGEFVGLAEQFVQDQSQIAELTQVLALNATLVAARATEQRNPQLFIVTAREFESIASQVSDLAQQTNDGLETLRQRTGQINDVVSAVDGEVQGLSKLVGGFTHGVEQSSQVFTDVRSATSEVVKTSSKVMESSQDILAAVQSTTNAIRDIAALAERTAQLTQTSQVQSEQMESLSQQLLSSIQVFQLPEVVAGKQ
jgi:methyl-accepting chemotaxis protein PixJ